MLESVIALIVAGVIFVGLGLWQVQGQVKYLTLYARKTGERISLGDQAAELVGNPLRGWLIANAATWRGIRVTSQRQDDAELERLRQMYFVRRRLWLGASAFVLVGLGVYLNLLNR